MPSLQIRNLPDDVYRSLALRAERAHRSLAQQAIVDLRKLPEEVARQRRKQVLKEIRQSLGQQGRQPLSARPEDLIRGDRNR